MSEKFAKERLKYISPMGDEMYMMSDSLIVKLNGHRSVVSSSNLCGGYRQDLAYIYNHSCAENLFVLAKEEVELEEGTLDDYFSSLAVHLGLPPEYTTGMDTAACVDNIAISTREVYGVTVMTLVTAGIDVNGGRAGDKATYDEFAKEGIPISSGTINILIFINAKLNAGVLTRAIVTATEAKSAALQELMANSMFSEGIATGSGTDAVIAVANDDAEVTLYSSGKHVLLGQMIGESVKEAVKKALDLQTGMNNRRQASVEWQSKRYGVTKEAILHNYLKLFGPLQCDTTVLHSKIDEVDTAQEVVATLAAITHLCDQNRWGIVDDEAAMMISNRLLNTLLISYQIEPSLLGRHADMESDKRGYKEVLRRTLVALAMLVRAIS